MIEVKFVLEGGQMPVKATNKSCGYDFILPNDVVIHHGRQVVPMDFRIGLPECYGAIIKARSGHSAKGMECRFSYTPEGKIDRADADVITGLVDPDYTGIVGVIIKSYELEDFVIPAGTHIAQMVILKCEDMFSVNVGGLEVTERGEGGFGHSTDK